LDFGDVSLRHHLEEVTGYENNNRK